ncbi:XRE family transcriptional regulator [Nostoc sp. 106C]|uniref:XRE family transcriptional regulator n=1 Tax=Nostoc sp. 106C TaxID=1932667 RepID=UPI000A375AE0|nr:XRE family transcriptional regulator [Nostoc sp. 106C]OUL33416.1 Zn peptidase [Nostoc sp. 106C]
MKENIAKNLLYYRKKAKLSQEKLAELAGVARQSISNYEKAKTLPDSKTLASLAQTLSVTLDDLLKSKNAIPSSLKYHTSNSFNEKPEFVTNVLGLLEKYATLERAIDISPYVPESFPCHELEGNDKNIQEIAEKFRYHLKLGDGPILNLFEAVEQVGLKVLRKPIPIPGFFGLSLCVPDKGAFVLINTYQISIERQLFTLGHELGHLICHRSEYNQAVMGEGTEIEEKVADYFASYLLVPQKEFERFYQYTKEIKKLKRHFRVSYQVILKRLAEMRIIDYGKEQAKLCAIYKKEYNASLKRSIELPPALDSSDFPENERYENLVWIALNTNKISKEESADFLNQIDKTIMQFLEARQKILTLGDEAATYTI